LAALAAGRQVGASNSLRTRVYAHAGNGIIHLHYVPERGPTDEKSLLALCQRLNDQVAALNGSVLWTRMPTTLKAALDLWAPVGNDFPLMRRTKKALDPRGVMCPGRFIGRL